MAFSPKGVIWVLSIFERIRLSRYCAAIRKVTLVCIAYAKRTYHIFTVKYVLFTYAIHAQVLCTYRDTISRKLYQFKICQNPYLPREIWTHITPPYHTPEFFFILSFFHLKLCWESCISSKFVKIHISLGRYGLISHPHITPQNFFYTPRKTKF